MQQRRKNRCEKFAAHLSDKLEFLDQHWIDQDLLRGLNSNR